MDQASVLSLMWSVQNEAAEDIDTEIHKKHIPVDPRLASESSIMLKQHVFNNSVFIHSTKICTT